MELQTLQLSSLYFSKKRPTFFSFDDTLHDVFVSRNLRNEKSARSAYIMAVDNRDEILAEFQVLYVRFV